MDAFNIYVSEPKVGPRELDLSAVVIPPRSRLINLTPFGVGSTRESLWGYLQRLARAHAVRFLDLLVNAKAPLVGYSERGPTLGRWKHEVAAVNGGTIGYQVARLFEKLTNRNDLVSLTLHGINGIPGLSVVARATHACCPWCLAEDREPYDRLLWTIADVSHCPRHGRRLLARCIQCGRAPRLFTTKSSVTHCDHCGGSKLLLPETPDTDDASTGFELWQSQQIADLLGGISEGELALRASEPRRHNLQLSALMPEVRGVTGLARELGLGRSTPWGWLHKGRTIQLKSAARWAWVTSTTLRQLFFERLSADTPKFQPLPPSIVSRRSRPHRPSVPMDSTALYLTALRLASVNPFLAPKVPALEEGSGVHVKHPAFKDVHFVRLMSTFRDRERRFLHKERVWREISDVHAAAVKVAGQRRTVSRHRVAAAMAKPGSFGGLIARSYLQWFNARIAAGDSRVLQPKQVPLDVRAYWDLQRERSGA